MALPFGDDLQLSTLIVIRIKFVFLTLVFYQSEFENQGHDCLKSILLMFLQFLSTFSIRNAWEQERRCLPFIAVIVNAFSISLFSRALR